MENKLILATLGRAGTGIGSNMQISMIEGKFVFAPGSSFKFLDNVVYHPKTTINFYSDRSGLVRLE